jgi:hypothetical protein
MGEKPSPLKQGARPKDSNEQRAMSNEKQKAIC